MMKNMMLALSGWCNNSLVYFSMSVHDDSETEGRFAGVYKECRADFSHCFPQDSRNIHIHLM